MGRTGLTPLERLLLVKTTTTTYPLLGLMVDNPAII